MPSRPLVPLLLAALSGASAAAPLDAVTAASPATAGAEWGREDFPRVVLLASQRRRLRAAREAPVVLARALDPAEAAERLLARLLPDPDPARPVLLKPNLGGYDGLGEEPDTGVRGRVTEARFVEGVVRYLLARGVRRITIADGRGVARAKDMDRAFAEAGYGAVVQGRPEVRLLALNHLDPTGPDTRLTEGIRFPVLRDLEGGGQLLVPRVYLEHLRDGLVIQVAKLKAHRFTVLSGGLKNLMGVLRVEGERGYPGRRGRMHAEYGHLVPHLPTMARAAGLAAHRATQEAFADRLVGALGVLLPHLTLMDGVLACEGTGFFDSHSVPLHAALGGVHPVAVDQAAAALVGLRENASLQAAFGLGEPVTLRRARQALGMSAGATSGWPTVIEAASGATVPVPTLGVLGVESPAGFRVTSTMEATRGRGGRVLARSIPEPGEVLPGGDGPFAAEDYAWLPRDRGGRRLVAGAALSYAWGRAPGALVLRFVGHRLPPSLQVGVQLVLGSGPGAPGVLVTLDRGGRASVGALFPPGAAPGLRAHGRAHTSDDGVLWIGELILRLPGGRLLAPGEAWPAEVFMVDAAAPRDARVLPSPLWPQAADEPLALAGEVRATLGP